MVLDGEVASCRLRRFVHSIRIWIWIRVDGQQRHVDKWKTVMMYVRRQEISTYTYQRSYQSSNIMHSSNVRDFGCNSTKVLAREVIPSNILRQNGLYNNHVRHTSGE